MLKAGTQTGSFFNHVYSGDIETVPQVGMGATILCWTDRHACTIIEVNKTGKTIIVQEDRATRIDGNGMSDAQSYEYARDESGTTYTFRKFKRGWKEVGGGKGLLIGHRRHYHDFSF